MAAGIAAAGGWFVYRSAHDLGAPADLIACLPRTGATLAYVDVDAVRRAGLLDLISGTKAVQDPEYRSFVESSGFDYRRDMDAVAMAFNGSSAFFVVRGRFDWRKLRDYTEKQKGECRDNLCRVRGSEPGRWVSYWQIRSGVMAIASSPNAWAALDITPRERSDAATREHPDTPIWMLVPPATLSESRSLPAGTQSFASPLASAERVVFSIAPSAGDQLKLHLDVTSPTESGAAELLDRLRGATDMLQKMLQRENLKANENDLSGLLSAGSFRREGRRVSGDWPLRRKLIEAIAGGPAG